MKKFIDVLRGIVSIPFYVTCLIANLIKWITSGVTAIVIGKRTCVRFIKYVDEHINEKIAFNYSIPISKISKLVKEFTKCLDELGVEYGVKYPIDGEYTENTIVLNNIIINVHPRFVAIKEDEQD